MVDINNLRRLALDGDLFAILEFIDRLEDAEETKNNWLRANAPGGWIDNLRMERNALHARIKEMEKERNDLRNEIACVKEVEFPRKAQAVADAWEGKCKQLEAERDTLRAALRHEADCMDAAKSEIEALHAKIAEMEQQEPAMEWWDCLIADISAVGCVHRGSPTYVHDAYWMRDRAVQILEKRRDSLPGAQGE